MERSIIFDYPGLLARGDDTLVMVVADGETEQEVYARAWTGAWAQMAQAPRPVPAASQPRGAWVPDEEWTRPYVDIRGKSWYQEGRVHWGVTLPSAYTLLGRVNFHPGRSSVYTDVGISREDPRWSVYRVGGRWPEWLVFPIDATSRSREDAKRDGAIVIGDFEHLCCELLEMGCNLSPHEKEQLRQIRGQLKR